MNLKDIIDLAKAGYKPADVKELIELADKHEQEESKEDEPKQEESKEDEPKQEESKEDEPKQEEIDKLKSQIKALQEANTKKDNSGNTKDDDDILTDFIRGFM